MKIGALIGRLALILLAAASVSLQAAAKADAGNAGSLTLSFGGFTLDGEPGVVSRWNEYRDIDKDGLTFGFDASNSGKNWLRWSASGKNLGYADAEGRIYLQTGELLTLSVAESKTPHYYNYGTAQSQARDRATTKLALFPLSKINLNASYINEDKSSTENGESEYDSLTLSLHGGSNQFGVNVEALDSRHHRDLGQYDSNGYAIQAAGAAKNRVWAASAYLIKKDFDAGMPALLSETVETTQSGIKSNFRIDKSLLTTLSYAKSEISNGSAGGIGLDTDKAEAGAVYKFNSGKAGVSYSKKTKDKTNADANEVEDKTLGFFVKGTVVKKVTVRVDRKDTVRSTSGINTIDFRNITSLAERVGQTRVSVTGAMSPSFRFTSAVSIKDEDFEPFTAISPLKKRAEMRNLSMTYQLNKRTALYQDALYQEVLLDEQGLLAPGSVRVAQTYDGYSLGMTYNFSGNADGGLSFGRSKSRIGEFAIPNAVNEKNMDAWYELRLRRGYEIRASLGHNSYSDRLNPGLSGVSDLMEVKISKTIKF